MAKSNRKGKIMNKINVKSVGLVIIGLVCLNPQSILGQEFYTQKGTDPTWKFIIDGKKVGDGAYNRPEGETSFRWGMYYGKSIPKSDALIFVTGATVNPPPVPNTSLTSP